jgi:hypothetical protein
MPTPQALPPPPSNNDPASLYQWLYKVYTVVTNTTGLATTSASGTELDYNDGALPGIAVAGKTVVLSSSKRVDVLDMTALKLSGVSVTASAAELNALTASGLTNYDTSALHSQSTGIHGCTISAGEEDTDVINVSIQFLDVTLGQAPTNPQSCLMHFSDNSDGSTISTTAPDGTVAIGTYGQLLDVSGAKKIFYLVTDPATGLIDINITNTTAATFYIAIQFAYGKLSVSDAITFV